MRSEVTVASAKSKAASAEEESEMEEKEIQKKPYIKPEITEIELRPEEAVLGSCKTAASAGPGAGRCNFPSACSSLGS